MLSWYWCDEVPCQAIQKEQFDYHQKSKSSSASPRQFGPGDGYGGGDARKVFPTENTSPDTTAAEAEKTYFADNEPIGLSEDAGLQVPDATLY